MFRKFKNNNAILVLGASGRIGNLLYSEFKKQTSPIIFYQIRDVCPNFLITEKTYKCNFFNEMHVSKLIQSLENKIDTVVGMVGVTGEDKEKLNNNLKFAKVMHKISSRIRAKKLIYFSTSAVYGLGGKFREIDATNPITAYGQSKKKSEEYLLINSNKELKTTCLRIGNVAGADALLGGAVSNKLHNNNLKVDIFDDGCGPIRNYIGPKTLARLILKMTDANKDLPAIINVGGNVPIDMKDLVQTYGISWEPRKVRNNEFQRIILDCKLLVSLFPDINFKTTTKDIVKELKQVLGS